MDTKLDLECAATSGSALRRRDRIADQRKVVGVDEREELVDAERSHAGLESEQCALHFIEAAQTRRMVHLPGAHAAGVERQAKALLARSQDVMRESQLGGPLLNADLELLIDRLQRQL